MTELTNPLLTNLGPSKHDHSRISKHPSNLSKSQSNCHQEDRCFDPSFRFSDCRVQLIKDMNRTTSVFEHDPSFIQPSSFRSYRKPAITSAMVFPGNELLAMQAIPFSSFESKLHTCRVKSLQHHMHGYRYCRNCLTFLTASCVTVDAKSVRM